ncbi:uncharacterized protein Hap1MRO34_026114 isoform 1-T1 [Clarias gariepinus]
MASSGSSNPLSGLLRKQGRHQETSSIQKDEGPSRKFFIIKTGNTLNSHKDFLRSLNKQTRLQEVFRVDECDFILGFCPVVSRAGIDVERALDKLQNVSDTKLTVLVVLHHTYDPDCIVQDSNRTVNFYCKINTIAVDCLFHEDVGLLQCHKNDESLFTTSTYIKSLHIQAMLREVKEKCGETKRKLEKNQMELKDKERQLESVIKELETSKNKLIERDKQLQEKDRLLMEKSETLEMKERDAALEQNETLLKQIQTKFDKTVKKLEDSQQHMEQKNTQLENMHKLETLGQELQDKKRQLQEMMIVLEQQETELAEKIKQFKVRLLPERETQLMKRDKQLQEQTDPESSAAIRRRNSKEVLHPKMSGELSSPHSPLSVPVAELRLVLLGRMGSGKSTAENTILSREERNQAAASTSTSTQGEVAGRKVTVVDTPDWFSPKLSLERLRQDVGLCVHLSAPGPHAFLLIIPVKQPKGEERGMLEKMEEIFGERCWRNTMIIFSVTNKSEKENIEEFIQSGDQEVQRLVEKCENRFHCLNIKESGDGSQVSELLEKIEKMMERNREKFYSSEIYLETESQIRAMEIKILQEREEKRMREEMEVKGKIDTEVQDSLRKIEGVIQEHEGDIRQLNDRTTELERKMKEERDEEKKRELERELKQEVERRAEMEKKVKKLKEKRERERREMEERHQQEMEEIREVYEGEVRMETERNLMKIILPELQRNMLASKIKMQEEFSRQMEEKNRELETLKHKLSDLTETYSLLEEVYEETVRSSSESERAAVTEEMSKGIFQTFTEYFFTG